METTSKWPNSQKPVYFQDKELHVMEQLVRYSPPTRYDVAPRCTICKVMGDEQIFTLYVQTGDSTDTATWVPMGELLEKAFNSFTLDHEFINACVDLSQSKEGSHMQIIVEKIKPK
jgi:hypothetical protein